MNQWFKYIFVIMAFIWLSAASADPAKALIGKEFSLGIGQTASIEGEKLVIKFKAVLEDSRCPVNVVCVWAGNGKVEFEILDIDGQNKTVTSEYRRGTQSNNTKGAQPEINLAKSA